MITNSKRLTAEEKMNCLIPELTNLFVKSEIDNNNKKRTDPLEIYCG